MLHGTLSILHIIRVTDILPNPNRYYSIQTYRIHSCLSIRFCQVGARLPTLTYTSSMILSGYRSYLQHIFQCIRY